ncbi:rhamnosyltransferase WsaF family glycosyltransferase [Paenibacillus sp. Marseille-Q7038]
MYKLFFYNLKKSIRVLQSQGPVKGTKFIINKVKYKNNNFTMKKDVFNLYNYLLLENNEPILNYAARNGIRLAWFIPDFGIGSGGHLNIFRMIKLLEELGMESIIYICGPSQWGSNEDVSSIIREHFFQIKADAIVLNNPNSLIERECDLAIATSWQTAYYVRSFNRCVDKAYFVQDFEPYFYAKGSNYSFAEQTYKFGFKGITAGDWLKEKLSVEYGMFCNSFSFSYEKGLYQQKVRRDQNVKRVFFYSRPPTDRRGFELGLVVLNEFCKLHPEIEVVMAGWDVSDYDIPFKHFNAGVVKVEELADLYSQCDVALILSFTNLSLLPLELLASGCPVVMNKGSHNDWLDPDHRLFFYVDDDISMMVSTLDLIINKEAKLDQKYSAVFLESSSWGNEAIKVGNYIEEILEGKWGK